MNRNPSPVPRTPSSRPTSSAARRRTATSRGVALVITLLLLSIITVVTVTILAIARRDRTATTQLSHSTDARLATDAALERAKAEMAAQILATTNLMAFDLTVSRSIPTNVTDLYADPRVPVFLPTNQMFPSEWLEGRFFLDLNRNALFEDTFLDGPVGDPQWIGILEYPDRPHGPNNRFVARYAFIVVPSGKGLDVNFIHNESSMERSRFGFFRNQGFGPWEVNLAAFFADLNPAAGWTYRYGPLPLPMTDGTAFADAKSFLAYRYDGNVNRMPSIRTLYGPDADIAFATDMIDGYANDPVVMGAAFPTADNDLPTQPWSGGDSLRHFFNHQEFFDPAKVTPDFTNRLMWGGANPDTNLFNQYTFYRMLAQLGTDSAPANEDKIHLNYVNEPITPEAFGKIPNLPTLATPESLSATNFVPWDLAAAPELAEQFFTNVAERIFREQFLEFNPDAPRVTNIASITRIPVSPTNEYSPALHRILQVAANIFDATRTNRFPSVFRPIFTTDTSGGATNIYITGYTNDNQRSTLGAWLTAYRPYGIPLVIGAKKGYPNFNEYTLRTDLQVTRKLEFVRADTNSPPFQTNQMYILGISNLFAAEAWNSYSTPYPSALQMEVSDVALVTITNAAGLNLTLPLTFAGSFTNLAANFWQGKEFKLPLYQHEVLLEPSRYLFQSGTFEPVGTNYYFTETQTQIGFPLPDWHLNISNQFLYVLSDGGNIVDCVFSRSFNSEIDVDEVLMQSSPLPGTTESPIVASLWDTNRMDRSFNRDIPTVGIHNQVNVALDNTSVNDTVWRNYLDDSARGMDKERSMMLCRAFFQEGVYGPYAAEAIGNTSLRMQSPFNPTRKLVKTVTWQANDPLVHTHVGDLMLLPTNSIIEPIVPPTSPIPTNMTYASLGRLNDRYSPWGGNPEKNDPFSPNDSTAYDAAIKDPGVRTSDDWNFPSGKFGSIGWLGRVHRGTPWQTIYWKPERADEDLWRQQSADYFWYPTNGTQRWRFLRTHPTNDWALADLFTVATDRNAARGLLSVNQTNLAAWSAVLSGVVLLKNDLSDEDLLRGYSSNSVIPLVEHLVEPLAVDTNTPPALEVLVNAINNYRRTLPRAGFTSLGEFLQVWELTLSSPWLNTATDVQRRFGLTDTAYERIPQQILSLVKVGDPRFVVYAYGQALQPARDSVQTAGPLTGVVTNYQVTAEVATRAVIRVDGGARNPRMVTETFNLLPPD